MPASAQPGLQDSVPAVLALPARDTALLSNPSSLTLQTLPGLEAGDYQYTFCSSTTNATQSSDRHRAGLKQVEHTLSILLSPFVLLNILGTSYHSTEYSKTCSTGSRELDVRPKLLTSFRTTQASITGFSSAYFAVLV